METVGVSPRYVVPKEGDLDLSDEDIEGREEVAKELAEAAHERRPDSQCWGLYLCDDGMSKAGAFLWFSSEAELLDFIALHLLFFTGPGTDPVEARLAGIGEIIDNLRKGKLEQEPARLAVNKLFKGLSQIVWWGTRATLFSADSEFPRGVRESFRSNERDESDSTGHPITEEEGKDFLQYLETCI